MSSSISQKIHSDIHTTGSQPVTGKSITTKTRVGRIFGGLALVLAILVIGFSIILPALERWGSTDAELALALPGDELLANPIVRWTTSETINAPVEQVWPWIAQIGDVRGGFYSYTFIENMVAGGDIYHNANQIIPALQQPAIGESIIGGALKVREFQPNTYLLADSTNELGWTWVWYLKPVDASHTRLIVRARIQPPDTGSSNPVLFFVMDAGGFVMQQNMVQGIRQRAEGMGEPAYIETIEILIWLLALLVGLAAAVLFVLRPEWKLPLLVGCMSVVFLMVLTFVQPAIWVRVLLDLALLAGAGMAFVSGRKPSTG